MSNASHTNLTCPSLGLMDDAETSLAFPSIWNNCYHSRPIASPKIKYQEEFCLCENHRECPLFLSGQTAPLPAHIRAPRSRRNKARRSIWKTLLVALIAVGVIFFLTWGVWGQGRFSPFVIMRPTETSPAAIVPTGSFTPPATMAASVALTLTSTITIPGQTGTPTESLSTHQLEVPIGTDHKFLIHRVLEGENLDQYAPKYRTTVEAIVAVNHALTPPVWVGTLVVIPIGLTDVSDLPSFEAYTITEAGMTIELLAQKFNVDLLDLKNYNAIDDGEPLVVGDWLLIPHKKSAP